MESAHPATFATVYAEATVGEDGALRLNRGSGPLRPGDKVMVAITPMVVERTSTAASLRGSVLRYDDPFGSAVPPEQWDAVSAC